MISILIDYLSDLMEADGYHYVGHEQSENQETLIFANENGECQHIKFGIKTAEHRKNYRVKLSELNYVKPKKIVIKCDFSKNDK